jgi:hypothetical protein
VLKGELFPSARLSCSGTSTPPKQQCYELAASDTSSTYLMSCSSSSSSSAGVVTTMTAPATTATATSSSASSSYNDAWSMVGPTTTASSRVSGGSSSQNNYEMELLLDDIHTSLNMVEDCFDPTASAAVNNNRRTSLSSSGAAEAVVEQPSHRGGAAPVAETFLWGLSNGTTNTSASSSPTWGIIGETTTGSSAATARNTTFSNTDNEPQGLKSRLPSFVHPDTAVSNTMTNDGTCDYPGSSFSSPVPALNAANRTRFRSTGSLALPQQSIKMNSSIATSPPLLRSNSYRGGAYYQYHPHQPYVEHDDDPYPYTPISTTVSQQQQQQQPFTLGYEDTSANFRYSANLSSYTEHTYSQQQQQQASFNSSPMFFSSPHEEHPFFISQQQQRSHNNRLIHNSNGNYSSALGFYTMDHHHVAANTTSEMISNMNGDILLADHHHGPAYPTTPQMHRMSSNGTLTTSPFMEHSPLAHTLASINGVDSSAISSSPGGMVTTISSLVGQIRRLSRDQMGCRMLQQALVANDPEVSTTIFHELLPHMADLMMDPFGNYLFQKLFDSISLKERELLVKTVSGRLVQASLNLHGTRSVQKIIDTVSTNYSLALLHHHPEHDQNEPLEVAESKNRIASMLATALKPAAARLCVDSHGNHVMQRILSGFPPQYTAFIYDCVATNVTDVARHRHGCCVIQRCLDSHPQLHYIDDNSKKLLDPCSASIIEARAHLIQQICAGALHLMQDAYGNYVVQYVLDICVGQPGEFDIIDSICRATIGQVALLSVQKFSSNVIEKCLEKCSSDMRELYLDEICNETKIRDLMTDPFGNYVVQRALGVASHTHAVKLVDSMKPHLLGMKNTAPGRRIIGKILRRFPSYVLDTMDETMTRAIMDNTDEY